MNLIELWYDKPIEVDPVNSWIANSTYLIKNTIRKPYEDCPYHKVLSIIEYSRPDFTLTVDGVPILVCEMTKENPSGNNIPQRFPSILRAAELGIPSIFYYMKYARKSTTKAKSNPPLNLNVRVLLAQLRLSELYNVPAMTLFMPTDPKTMLATSKVTDHKPLAILVEKVLQAHLSSHTILSSTDSLVLSNKQEQINAINDILDSTGGKGYIKNASYRAIYSSGNGFISKYVTKYTVDPTRACQIITTDKLLQQEYIKLGKKYSKNSQKIKTLLQRKNTFVYKGTADKKKTGPEHPYPGSLTLLDILYVRQTNGITTHDREMNIAFRLPISLQAYIDNSINKTTGLNILNIFCDIIILDDAIVISGWMLNLHAGAVLVKK